VSKYDEHYNGVSDKLNVYDSFLTEIEISTRTETLETNSVFNIDNTGCERIYPKLTFTNKILDGEIISSPVSISVSETVDATEVILDFKNQVYTADGNSIVDKLIFNDNERLYIEENSNVTIEVSVSGVLSYYYYPDLVRERFVQSFQISSNTIFNASRTKKIDEEFEFTLSKYKTEDSTLLQDIQEGKIFRIKFKDYEIEDYTSETSYLLEVTINDWDVGFSEMGDLLVKNISGEAQKLI